MSQRDDGQGWIIAMLLLHIVQVACRPPSTAKMRVIST